MLLVFAAKLLFFVASKWLGLFHVARWLTADGLRVLCYHGLALEDEGDFRPPLFISVSAFERRMRTLARHRFPVLELEEALRRQSQGTLPPAATVITIDDGFFSVYSKATPILASLRFPATVYVATHHVVAETPVFALVVQYMLWKTERSEVSLAGRAWFGDRTVDLADRNARERLAAAIVDYGERHCTESERVQICEELGSHLGVDYGRIKAGRFLSLMTREELRELAAQGFDLQLHSHRHQFAEGGKEAAAREIEDNRRVLEPLVGRRLRHFCYPSGVWQDGHGGWLVEWDVESATTCEPGLNYAGTPRWALRRTVDGEDVSQVEFEAEMFGYTELIRRARRGARRVFARMKGAPAPEP